jgi:hypothetical protein
VFLVQGAESRQLLGVRAVLGALADRVEVLVRS